MFKGVVAFAMWFDLEIVMKKKFSVAGFYTQETKERMR